MTSFTITETKRRPYLYMARSTSMDPAEIAHQMGICFNSVASFMAEHKIRPTGKAMAVYPHFDAHGLTFHAGFPVSQAKAKLARGDIQAGVIPPCKTLSFRHVGPYHTLRAAYGEMMGYMQLQGLHLGSPTWEVYERGPDDTTEAQYETVVHAALA